MNDVEQSSMLYLNEAISRATNLAIRYGSCEIGIWEFNMRIGDIITNFPQFRNYIEIVRSSVMASVNHKNRTKDND